MFSILLSALFIGGAVFVFLSQRESMTSAKRIAISGGLLLVGLFLFVSQSFLFVGKDELVTKSRVYFGESLPEGRIIAFDNEKGPQADIYGPGFHFEPFVRFIYDLETHSVIDIPEGQYGFMVAKDGQPLPRNAYLANGWENKRDMLDAEFFLKNGGQKGPQLEVLEPGRYRINPYLFDVVSRPATDVPTGHVAVIRSNVQTEEMVCPVPSLAKSQGNDEVAKTIVPKGCVGVWDIALPSGRYYLNDRAFVSTIIPTRLQNWEYKGGYIDRKINLTVEDNGKITQSISESEQPLPVPAEAADPAVNVRVEGWTVPVEMRVVVAVNPASAAKVVSAVGDLQKVEDNIITPAIRDILRTIGGKRKVQDFMDKREEIVNEIEQALIPEARKAGVTIQEVRMGEPAIPPELLVATLREQLATQLKDTYTQERQAQELRIQVEQKRATADQQRQLVAAQIREQAAVSIKNEQQLLGEGEKLRLLEIAEGQEAQAMVLGKEAALYLSALDKAVTAAVENPDIVKVPTVNVNSGGGSSFEGAAAILGASNILQMMNGVKGPGAAGALPPAINTTPR